MSAYIVSFIFLFLISELAINTSLFHSKVGYLFHYVTDWVTPIKQISLILFPYESIRLPNGSVMVMIPFFRMTLAEFLDILFYIIIAVIIGKLIAGKRKKVEQT